MRLKSDLRQKHVEAWAAEYRRLDPQGVVQYRGDVVRAALAAGWFEGVADGFDVGEMLPGEVHYWSQQIDALYAEVTIVPENLS